MKGLKFSRNRELLKEERRLRREIDCYIYELNAAQLRYQFLLQNFKKREL